MFSSLALNVNTLKLTQISHSCSLLNNILFIFPRYIFEKEGKMCTLRIKECRPDDECEYACGVDDKRSRARLFVEGEVLQNLLCMHYFLCSHSG